MGNVQKGSQSKPVFGPYSPIRKAGNFYFVSGQVGVNPATKTASRGVAEQTQQALTNLGNVLKSAGLGFDDVVKITIFITDMSCFGVVNDVYVGYFSEPRPARSTIAVAELPRVAGDTPVKIEIDAIAIKEP